MGKFSDNVKKGKIVGPRKKKFTHEQWQSDFKKSSDLDEIDKSLYNSGLMIYSKLEAIRKATEKSSLSRLSHNTKTMAIVSTANHQFEALELKLRNLIEDLQNNPNIANFHVTDISNIKIKIRSEEEYSPNDLLGSTLDGLAKLLSFLSNQSHNPILDTFDDVQWQDIAMEMNLIIKYDEIESLWEDCVWNTYILECKNQYISAYPKCINSKLGLAVASPRKIALAFEAMYHINEEIKSSKSVGKKLKIKDILSVTMNGDHQHIKIGSKKSEGATQLLFHAMSQIACPPFYRPILDEEQPLLAGATLSQLLNSWIVVSKISKEIWKSVKSNISQDFGTISNMSNYNPFLKTEVLIAAVGEATKIPTEQARAIIKFITFRGKEKQEFWTQPLVQSDDASKLYPIFGALAVMPDLRFVIERWMLQLGVNLAARGPVFEKYLREILTESIKKSHLLSKIAKVVSRDYKFKYADKSSIQIDALFCVGCHVFVVEAKCLLEPIDATSVGTHRDEIEHAAKQAKDRVKIIDRCRDKFITDMKQFGWELPSQFLVHPLIVVSTVAHVGVPSGDVPVLDRYVLQKFFSGSYDDIGLGRDFSTEDRVTHNFYKNEAEAEAGVCLYFQSPPQLKQYLKKIESRKLPIVAVSEDDWQGTVEYYQ